MTSVLIVVYNLVIRSNTLIIYCFLSARDPFLTCALIIFLRVYVFLKLFYGMCPDRCREL